MQRNKPISKEQVSWNCCVSLMLSSDSLKLPRIRGWFQPWEHYYLWLCWIICLIKQILRMDNIITKESLRKLEAFCKQKPNLYPFMVLVHYLKVFLDFVERSKSSTKDIDSAIRFFGRLVKVLLEVVSSSHCVLHAKRAYLWFNFNHQRYICSKDIKGTFLMSFRSCMHSDVFFQEGFKSFSSHKQKHEL